MAMTPYRVINRRAPRRGDGRPSTAGAVRRLRLLPSGDGWSLVEPDGALVFSALGLDGRRRCLEFAQAAGVVALAS